MRSFPREGQRAPGWIRGTEEIQSHGSEAGLEGKPLPEDVAKKTTTPLRDGVNI